jgi:hypothetical protein
MTQPHQFLREGLGNASEERLTPETAQAMRRIVVAEARAHAHEETSLSSPRLLVFALTVLLMIAAGITGGRMNWATVAPAGDDAKMPAVAPGAAPAPPRQLQFATPGGTRIIWVFNSDFDLKVTNP